MVSTTAKRVYFSRANASRIRAFLYFPNFSKFYLKMGVIEGDKTEIENLKREIEKRFKEAGFSWDYPYPRDSIARLTAEILNFLDKTARNKFDRQTAATIFDRCQENELGDTLIPKFILTLCEGVSISKRQIAILNNKLEVRKTALHSLKMTESDLERLDRFKDPSRTDSPIRQEAPGDRLADHQRDRSAGPQDIRQRVGR